MTKELRKLLNRTSQFAWWGSIRLRGREDRRAAKRDLKRGIEPQPRYTTGKQVVD